MSAESSRPFAVDPLVEKFTVSAATYLSNNSHIQQDDGTTVTVNAIGSGALVINQASPSVKPRILLIRRAASDSMPNLWEVPGGAVDDTDDTVLHGMVRELSEEAGLVATRIGPAVGRLQVFQVKRGTVSVVKVQFLCEVRDVSEVRLDPNEHSAFVWATAEDCERGRVLEREGDGDGDGLAIPFTSPQQKAVVLEAFEVWKAIRGKGERG